MRLARTAGFVWVFLFPSSAALTQAIPSTLFVPCQRLAPLPVVGLPVAGADVAEITVAPGEIAGRPVAPIDVMRDQVAGLPVAPNPVVDIEVKDNECPNVPDLIVRYGPSRAAAIANQYEKQSERYRPEEAVRNLPVSVVHFKLWPIEPATVPPTIRVMLTYRVANKNDYPVRIEKVDCEVDIGTGVPLPLHIFINRQTIGAGASAGWNDSDVGTVPTMNAVISSCTVSQLSPWSRGDPVQDRF